MQYKKILLDIDGTILDKQEKLSDSLAKALEKIKDNTSISFCTGRTPDFTLDLAQRLNLTTNHIVDDGSRVIDANGKELWAIILPQEVINYYLNLAALNGFKIAATVEGKMKLVLTKQDQHISRLFPYHLTKKQVDILTSHIFSSEYEVKVVWSDEKKGYNVSVTHINGNKKHGIQYLLDHEGIKKEDVIGVGDGINDIPLFEEVGFKVAMADAPYELKTKADLVVSSVEKDGVVEILRKLSL